MGRCWTVVGGDIDNKKEKEMMFFVIYVLLSLGIPVGLFCFIHKKWKSKKSYDKTDTELLGGLVWTLVVTLIIVSACFFEEMCESIWDYEHPVCIEYVSSLPVQRHWSRPNFEFVQIPSGFPNFILKNNSPYSLGRENWLIQDGKRLSTTHEDFVLIPEKDAPKDSLRFYVYSYKKWGPFEVPPFMRHGHACFGEPPLIQRGKCKTQAEVK